MPDPEMVSTARRAAVTLERAWERWRVMHGLAIEPAPPVSSYVGYSIEEPWGRPRVVFGVDAREAEMLAAILEGHQCAGPFYRSRAAAWPDPAELGVRDRGNPWPAGSAAAKPGPAEHAEPEIMLPAPAEAASEEALSPSPAKEAVPASQISSHLGPGGAGGAWGATPHQAGQPAAERMGDPLADRPPAAPTDSGGEAAARVAPGEPPERPAPGGSAADPARTAEPDPGPGGVAGADINSIW